MKTELTQENISFPKHLITSQTSIIIQIQEGKKKICHLLLNIKTKENFQTQTCKTLYIYITAIFVLQD